MKLAIVKIKNLGGFDGTSRSETNVTVSISNYLKTETFTIKYLDQGNNAEYESQIEIPEKYKVIMSNYETVLHELVEEVVYHNDTFSLWELTPTKWSRLNVEHIVTVWGKINQQGGTTGVELSAKTHLKDFKSLFINLWNSNPYSPEFKTLEITCIEIHESLEARIEEVNRYKYD